LHVKINKGGGRANVQEGLLCGQRFTNSNPSPSSSS